MGDRGNIIVDGVYLYSHWDGHGLPQILQNALKRGKSRWNDSPYLARIIFCDMIKEQSSLDDLTGYGISITRGDGGVDIVVDTEKGTVKKIKGEYGEKASKTYSFEDYIALDAPNEELLGNDE